MSARFAKGYADPQGKVIEVPGYGITLAVGTTVPADATAGYAPGCIFMDQDGAAGAQVYVNEGTLASCAFKALPSLAATGAVALGVAGVAAGCKLARGVVALDGSNPTTVATGLSTIVSAQATIQRTSAVSSGTAFVTVDFTGSDGNLNLYGWVVAGTASPGTENINWVAIGT